MRRIFPGIVVWPAALWLSAISLRGQNAPESWVAQDAPGRRIGLQQQYGPPRENKTVGMFYVVWHGAHGFDRHEGKRPDEGIMRPSAADTLSPYDIQKLQDANPSAPAYGPLYAFHHWGEPYLGYYLSDDRWVIRKHAQMLSDAGVDVVIVDLTNEIVYLPVILTLCEEYRRIRSEGGRTPAVSFLFHTLVPNSGPTVRRLYESFYRKGLYSELWFRWKGKPLIFCPPEALTPETAAFFTARHSWFDSRQEWFGDGRDRCAWADVYPQRYGWHDTPGEPEMIAVAPATHPTQRGYVPRIGRSYHGGVQPEKERQRPGDGLCFAEQFSRAMEVDPEFVFFAGWNEWSAMRFVNEGDVAMIGDDSCRVGDTFFCDDYNHEYSRDLEPLRGDFGDNYYYQLCDFIRRFKGVEEVPVHGRKHRIDPDDFAAWAEVGAVYRDDRGDTFHRDHPGYGARIGRYANRTGRNDIVCAKAATDGRSLFFYARTDEPLTPPDDSLWMRLFVSVEGSGLGEWEGFHYRINDRRTTPGHASVERSLNGWHWQYAAEAALAAAGREIVLAVPLRSLGIRHPDRFCVDFKWIDNAVPDGDIRECLSDGDSAPNGRFRYRFRFDRHASH